MKTETIIEGRYGIGYRQSPYLYNNFGFRAMIADGNSIAGVTAKSNYVKFFDCKITIAKFELY